MAAGEGAASIVVKPPCPGVPPFPPHSSSQFRSLSDSSHHVSTHRYSSPRAEEAEEEGEGAREEEGGVEVADGWAGAKGVEKWKVKTVRGACITGCSPPEALRLQPGLCSPREPMVA